MPQTLFISDLHLDRDRPRTLEQFARFLAERAPGSDALYILGDLFEYWIGDDDPAPHLDEIVGILHRLSREGLAVYFAHGNRDFLVGEAFAERCGCALLETETVIDLYGTPVLLMHGDSLCTDDEEYMQFRRMVRTRQWQSAFLARPLAERHAEAEAMRAQSQASTRSKSDRITDVNPAAVEDALRRNGVHTLIHGHTHRPAVHDLHLDGQPARRIVLPDWYGDGGVLACTPQGMALQEI
ncbi:UDP-2,3-diacylglucosamine diphosphatase [Ectothiorhodospira sp. 9100]|uniref:UDP-2,3-diacylglucosamine diphosphatase n=1 Tax=unclassified Ectothiorhodospira TaxID=2684909 RepID=UPI001EE792D5|nr:UDP-2,3-diacylglucosamine diphosphatase [Ectothiorhodospira sp. 9100]MCG5519703.1 UDP-2,3-diacylglucosamine diphosphatase [Ectothiorhodospira sp. 9905]